MFTMDSLNRDWTAEETRSTSVYERNLDAEEMADLPPFVAPEYSIGFGRTLDPYRDFT